MQAELKSLTSVDINETVFRPDSEEIFGFNVEASIGPKGRAASDIFTFFVCTPAWLLSRSIRRDFGDCGVFGRHMIIVVEYDWAKIQSMIQKLCEETHAESWEEVSRILAQFGRWEYEGQTSR